MTMTISHEQADRFGQGTCVAMIERNGYDDSEFSGIFAVPVHGGYRFEKVTTGSTAYAGGFVPQPDATDEVKAAYRAERAQRMAEMARERAERAARVPEVGRAVVVVNPPSRGKNKVEQGAVGEVVWRGKDEYRSSDHFTRYRVGVEVDGRRVFVEEDRVRVVGHEDQPVPDMSSQVDAIIAAAWPAI